MDPVSVDPSSAREFSLSLHIALLCIQELPEDKPNMSYVVSMLTNESANLPSPKQAAFSSRERNCSGQEQQGCSLNDITYSVMEAR